MEHVLSHHSQIIGQTSINHLKYALMDLKLTRRRGKQFVVQIYRKEMITWHERWQSLQSHHCIVWQRRFYQIRKNLQKLDNYIVISNNGNGYACHTWCENGTNGKKMSCPSPICHTQILILIDIRTMSFWKWITFFDTHCFVFACAVEHLLLHDSLFWTKKLWHLFKLCNLCSYLQNYMISFKMLYPTSIASSFCYVRHTFWSLYLLTVL